MGRLASILSPVAFAALLAFLSADPLVRAPWAPAEASHVTCPPAGGSGGSSGGGGGDAGCISPDCVCVSGCDCVCDGCCW